LYRRTRDVWELHRRSDLVEISDVGMRIVMSEELLVLNEVKQTVLKLKVVRGDFGHNENLIIDKLLGNSSKRKTHKGAEE
ncbi:hypothetical protein Tco_0806601, partial [Tanacetum coccineum]